MSSTAERAIVNQYRSAAKRLASGISVRCKDGNMFEWYVLIKDMDGVFAGGQYLYKLVADKVKFPHAAPATYALTPNGVWMVGGRVCLGGNTSDYHSSEWSAALGMAGVANNLQSTMINWQDIEWKGVVGCEVQSTVATPGKFEQLAAQSVEYNKTCNADIIALFQ